MNCSKVSYIRVRYIRVSYIRVRCIGVSNNDIRLSELC